MSGIVGIIGIIGLMVLVVLLLLFVVLLVLGLKKKSKVLIILSFIPLGIILAFALTIGIYYYGLFN